MKRAKRPWLPIEWDVNDALAIRSLFSGTSSEGQQKKAIDWILDACLVGDQTFVPPDGNDPHGRLDAFLEGKRSIGNQILKLRNVNLETIHDRT